MNNMAKMVMMNNGGRSGGSGGNRNGGNGIGRRGGSNGAASNYDTSSYDMSYGSIAEHDQPENRRRRDRMGRYMEGDESPEMNGGYSYSTMGGYDDSPEMRRAGMHAMPKNQIGFSGMEGHKKFDQATAQEWTKGMKNADGTSGPHWTFDQAKSIMAQHNVSGIQPSEFWAVLNALYSDYCRVAKKYGVDRPDFYMEMAKAWLNDEDAVEDKAAAYFQWIVK